MQAVATRLPVAENKPRKTPYSQQRLGRMKAFLRAVENEAAILRGDIEQIQTLTSKKTFALLSEDSRLSISQDAERKLHETLFKMRRILGALQVRIERQ
jgi:hypothetical protein